MKCKKCGKELVENARFCEACGEKVTAENEQNIQPIPEVNQKKPLYKKPYFWVILAGAIILILCIINFSTNKNYSNSSERITETTIAVESATKESDNKKSTTKEPTTAEPTTEAVRTSKAESKISKKEAAVSKEYTNALKSAKSYSDSLHMSKKAIYDQLVSEYGGRFSEDAAQYAIDNLDADYNKNALESAESYVKNLHLSKQALYDQLVSEYGGQFTDSEAAYATDNVNADWNDIALSAAKDYQETLSMSKSAIYDQLTSEYGGQFTESEAQYAIDHLED